MKLQVKQIHVIKKVFADNGTYAYQKTIIPINQIMTPSELKSLQKQTAINFDVPQNMIGGIYNEIE